VAVPGGALELDTFLAAHPLAEGANVRVDQVGRTGGASYHVVQLVGAERPHRHVTHDLTVLLLRGRGILHRDAARTRLDAGDAAVVPRGEPHWFASEGAFPSVALVVFTPPLDVPDAEPLDDVDSRGHGR
jgi:quercetin dioxygenase-like cupin family protein